MGELEQSKVALLCLSQRYIRKVLSGCRLVEGSKGEFVHAVNVKGAQGRVVPLITESSHHISRAQHGLHSRLIRCELGIHSSRQGIDFRFLISLSLDVTDCQGSSM